ncbi:MAG: VWA domain-containing protein [Symploca sp. SIO2G7]|nr:VWA domain-containing protein [Symploca sp. SIO2G7]
MSPLPGGELANRPLHFIWICDCSGSMSINGKIQALNTAIKEALPAMRDVAKDNANAEVLVRAVKFSDGAQWHVATPTPVDSFSWTDLTTTGLTDMGKALSLVAEQLKMPPMTNRALPPVLVLISDGQPTDDFNSGLRNLMDQPWGKRAVRIAIAIGGDADKEVLRKFIAHPELQPLEANNAEDLVRFIRWASTAVLQSASSPSSQPRPSTTTTGGETAAAVNVPVPTTPPPSSNPDEDDVW